MGRGSEASTNLLYGTARRRIDWPARIERLEHTLSEQGLEEAFEFACSWRQPAPGRHGRYVARLLGDAEAERRWPQGQRVGDVNEYVYLQGRVLELTEEILADPEGRYGMLAAIDEGRWLWERPKDPGFRGRRLLDGNMRRTAPKGLAELLGGLRAEDRQLINDEPWLWERPLLWGAMQESLVAELQKAEKATRDLLYRLGVLERHSPDFYTARKGHTVHYEDQGNPGKTPCGLELERLVRARRGDWVGAIGPGQMWRYNSTKRCKKCEKRGEAPEDHDMDALPVFSFEEGHEIRESLRKAIGILPVLPDQDDVVAELQERIDAEARDRILEAATTRFLAQPLEVQGNELGDLMYDLPRAYRDSIVIEKLPEVSKRRILAMVYDVGVYRTPTSAIVKEIVDAGAVSPELSRQVIEAVKEADRVRAERGW